MGKTSLVVGGERVGESIEKNQRFGFGGISRVVDDAGLE